MALDAELDAARVYLGVALAVARATDRVVVSHRARDADADDDAQASCDVVVTIEHPDLWPNSPTTIKITRTRGADDDGAASALAASIARDAEAFERTEGYLVAVLGAARARAGDGTRGEAVRDLSRGGDARDARAVGDVLARVSRRVLLEVGARGGEGGERGDVSDVSRGRERGGRGAV